MESLFVIIGIFAVLGTPLGVIALVLLDKMRRRVEIVESELTQLRGSRPPEQAGAAELPEDRPIEEIAENTRSADQVAESDLVAAKAEQPVEEKTAPWSTGKKPAKPARKSSGPSFESRLASQWMVWLGGAAVALSAVFLFRYAIEQGWLGPVARVSMGILLGAALIAGGEYLRRYVPGKEVWKGRDQAPAALTAAGIAALYAAIYSAHGLFGLIGPVLAFSLLAAVSFAAVIIAGKHGRFVAVLGMVGGYIVPLLTPSPDPNATALFVYILALTGGCLWLLSYRKWRFLAVATILGSVGWPALWLVIPWQIGDQGVLGLYLIALAAIYAWFNVSIVQAEDTAETRGILARFAVLDTSGIGMLASAVLLIALAVRSEFNAASFVMIAGHALVAFYFGLRRNAAETMLVIAALTSATVFLIWPQPAEISVSEDVVRRGVEYVRTAFGPFDLPPEFILFARAVIGFAALFGVGATLAVKYARTPAVWAGVAAVMPIFLFSMAYWRIDAFAVDVGWAGIALFLAALYLAAASWVSRRLDLSGKTPLAFYAAAVTAAISLALVAVLREAWLTVALALEVLALAWIWNLLRVRALHWITSAVAVAVMVRLSLNPQILEYQGAAAGATSWVFYGYGLPAISFFWAARIFSQDEKRVTAVLCDAGALAFAILMVSFQIRIWMSGGISSPSYGLAETAVQSLWWAVVSAALLGSNIVKRSRVAKVGGRILLGAATVQIFLVQVLISNPAFTGEAVGSLPVLNLLALAYLLPALIFLVFALAGGFGLPDQVRRGAGVAAFLLGFIYISLETLHLFQGKTASLLRGLSDGELYGLSVAWTLFALGLLAAAIRFRAPLLRYGSLVVMIGTVLKVFLFDMSDLTGLLRVASFLGLGLTLIGIGLIYRHFVFEAPQQLAESEA